MLIWANFTKSLPAPTPFFFLHDIQKNMNNNIGKNGFGATLHSKSPTPKYEEKN